MTVEQESIAIEISAEMPNTDTAFFIYLDDMHQPITDNWREFVPDFENFYIGVFESDTDFYEYMAEEMGLLNTKYITDKPNLAIETLVTYFDVESWGRDLLLGGDYWSRDGHYFRSY